MWIPLVGFCFVLVFNRTIGQNQRITFLLLLFLGRFFSPAVGIYKTSRFHSNLTLVTVSFAQHTNLQTAVFNVLTWTCMGTYTASVSTLSKVREKFWLTFQASPNTTLVPGRCSSSYQRIQMVSLVPNLKLQGYSKAVIPATWSPVRRDIAFACSSPKISPVISNKLEIKLVAERTCFVVWHWLLWE